MWRNKRRNLSENLHHVVDARVRSKQRGFLELDMVLGKWVEDHIHSMDENGIKSLVHVLDLEMESSYAGAFVSKPEDVVPVSKSPLRKAIMEFNKLVSADFRVEICV